LPERIGVPALCLRVVPDRKVLELKAEDAVDANGLTVEVAQLV
jgi:hypothetical protein